jgi:hypothetical protein
MDRFLENAERIFEGGRSGVQAGIENSAWTVLIHADGGVEMVAGEEWRLERIACERGAEMAYRVRVNEGDVRVEGVAAGKRFAMEGEAPGRAARALLGGPRGLLAA